MTRIAAEEYLDALAAHGIEYLFVNPGTDFAPIVEAYAEAARTGAPAPQPMLAAHENLAVSMAHGYAMISRRIPAVMVHVSVGTANMICAAMNVARENVGMLLTAGRSPVTEFGQHGSRDGYIHWAQEMYDQAGMLREIVKWEYELRNASQLETVVDRALAIAASEPRGPVYLSLPREVLAEQAAPLQSRRPRLRAAAPAAVRRGSACTARRASAKRSGSSVGTSAPASTSIGPATASRAMSARISDGPEAQLVATTGSPQAIASTRPLGKPSALDGMANSSARASSA